MLQHADGKRWQFLALVGTEGWGFPHNGDPRSDQGFRQIANSALRSPLATGTSKLMIFPRKVVFSIFNVLFRGSYGILHLDYFTF